MQEFFIDANSNAAPFFSDNVSKFVTANTPEEALLNFISSKPHPCGIYAAVAYKSSYAKMKGEKPIARWLCNFAIQKDKLTEGISAYGFTRFSDSEMEIDGQRHFIENPTEGQIVKD